MTTSQDPIERLVQDTEDLEPTHPEVMGRGDYIRSPSETSEDLPESAGMVVSDLASAGYSYLYETRTNEPTLVNNNMRAAQLMVTRPEDGSLVFQSKKPSKTPWRGSIKCFLHADQPDRAWYTAMGFSVCRKATLPNQYQADNHARARHKEEWAAVVAARERREREEDREIQRNMANALAGRAAQAQVPEAEPDLVQADPPAEREKEETSNFNADGTVTGACDVCGKSFTNRDTQRLNLALRMHGMKVHK